MLLLKSLECKKMKMVLSPILLLEQDESRRSWSAFGADDPRMPERCRVHTLPQKTNQRESE
ncbi:hypothetical protein M407DRAFT_153389 [Tulasnella calospora MUT 4182]|uniref:Uncharacterized protein n=1 Tax=Tulasnella calospora MUT 4182 TaxID=1051891 RepID=A0A0C3Q5Q1_9AGAM|nr:hypothetical protein M407DRAFT_153389 [Tulasnella calospora MUT 4182]